MTRNIKIISCIMMAMLLALICRLAYIQLIGHAELAAATRSQSLIALEGSNTRGIIYDCNGEPLVADEKSYIYIIKKDNFDRSAEESLTKLNADLVSENREGYYIYSSEKYNRKYGARLIKENSAYVLQASARYSEDQPAAHLIGYVNRKDSSGAAGLELMYDDRLGGLNRRVYAVADVKGNILPGQGLLIASDDEDDSYVKDGITTTLDKNLQIEVEKIIGEIDNNCAVVVLNSKTGGIAALACTPDFNPNEAYKYVKSSGDRLINKATQGEYPPGSIFKIVVAAAALEEGIDTDKEYNCSGSVALNEIVIECDTGGDEGHGEITMEDAFAQSCNSFFVQLGQELGSDVILETAEKMGFGNVVIDGYPQESDGNMMSDDERAGDAIGNLSIGQGECLATPIQIAAMTNIVACGGVDKGVHLLMDEAAEENHVISQTTADKLAEMMELVTLEGTGTILKNEDTGTADAAVKTGTAEYGKEDESHAHGWITGFAPCDDPEYVITVLVEDGGYGSKSAGPIFKKIMDYLEESGGFSRPTFT